MQRLLQLDEGRALIVSDLHGAWEPYKRYRDTFIHLTERGEADIFILLGDVIHGYGPEEEDRSLEIVIDLLNLRQTYGPDKVILLLGNHELPHIYNFTLAKGGIEFTARFEHRIGRYRQQIVELFNSLPFLIATRGGLLMHHAGVDERSPLIKEQAERILDWSHSDLLAEADRLIAETNLKVFIQSALGWDMGQYQQMALDKLAINGPDDPRFTQLLRGLIITEGNEDFTILWDFFFPMAVERGMPLDAADRLVRHFLELYSPETRARVLLTGHLPVEGGYAVVTDHLFRLASYNDAHPKEAGCGLLVDLAKPVHLAEDLIPHVIRLANLV